MTVGLAERRGDPATSEAGEIGFDRILHGGADQLLSLSRPIQYAIAVLGPLFSTLVQLVLLPEPSIAPFVFFYFAVALVSWVAGGGPGLLSVALSALLANYMFVTPYRQWALSGPALTATTLFLIGGGAVSLLCASFRRALLTAKRTSTRLAYLASFPEKNPNPIAEAGIDGRVTYANPAALHLFPDLLDKGATHPWLSGWEAVAHSVRGGSPIGERVVTIDDRTFLQVLTLLPGQQVRTYGADISERARAERAFRSKEAELELILNRTPFMLTRCSRDLRYLYVSRAYADMIGRTPDAVAGQPIVDVMGEKGFTTIRPYVETVLRGQPVEYETAVHFSGVGERLLQVVYVPDKDEQEHVIGWVASIIDVTERRHAQEALRAANARLIEADRRKTEFLAMLSHELRNPLAPIRNSLYILDRAAPGGEQARRAQMVIDRQVTHMARLVNDLLDVTRISLGKTHLQLERLDVADLVTHTAEDFRASFTNNGVALEVSVPALPLWIKGDRVRVAQLVGNLLNNAAKFTERGGKAAVVVEEDLRLGQVVIRVRDTGAGIAPEILPKLFEPFMQADRSLDRSSGGLGLGLALVKGLVEMHDGTVNVASEGLGKGAEFTVRLQLETGAAPAGAEVRRVPERAPSRRVLVIEDNVDAAETLREALDFNGHCVEVAHTGEAGIARARAFKPDVVLCDIGLPGMDGYEVARAMRTDPAFQATKLVALTGYAGPEDIDKSREAGFHYHIAKPPSYSEIERILAGVTSSQPDGPVVA